jgi:hypothetical protein
MLQTPNRKRLSLEDDPNQCCLVLTFQENLSQVLVSIVSTSVRWSPISFCPRNLFNPRVSVLLNLVLRISRFPVFCFEFGPVQNLGSWMALKDSKHWSNLSKNQPWNWDPKPKTIQHWSKLKARNPLFHDTLIRREKDDSCTIKCQDEDILELRGLRQGNS